MKKQLTNFRFFFFTLHFSLREWSYPRPRPTPLLSPIPSPKEDNIGGGVTWHFSQMSTTRLYTFHVNIYIGNIVCKWFRNWSLISWCSCQVDAQYLGMSLDILWWWFFWWWFLYDDFMNDHAWMLWICLRSNNFAIYFPFAIIYRVGYLLESLIYAITLLFWASARF